VGCPKKKVEKQSIEEFMVIIQIQTECISDADISCPDLPSDPKDVNAKLKGAIGLLIQNVKKHIIHGKGEGTYSKKKRKTKGDKKTKSCKRAREIIWVDAVEEESCHSVLCL
jgi:hypothetical protein